MNRTPRTQLKSPACEPLEPRRFMSAAAPVPPAAWAEFGGDAQHTAISPQASQPLQTIHWNTPVDLDPQFTGGELFVHYGSPVVTAKNTVIVPLKTGADGGFMLKAFDGATGQFKWSFKFDYVLPPHGYISSFSPAIAPNGKLYVPGIGGSAWVIRNPDGSGQVAADRLAFVGLAKYVKYRAAYNANVFIDTPMTIDKGGNVFFGYQVVGNQASSLGAGGIARLTPVNSGSFTVATTAAGDPTADKLPHDCAPALSNDGKTLYVAVNHTDRFGAAGIRSHPYLLALNSTTLKTVGKVELMDPTSGDAQLPDFATASPTVGPDGDVYFGVLENSTNSNHGRGWMLHFSADLKQAKTPGSFGWDDTASIVPAGLVPSYKGSSNYLLLTKYNDYADNGGSGINKIAILDPAATQIDPVTGATVMKEVLTIAGVTPDANWLPQFAGAVKEWCINTAAVDPFTDSVLANSEDGVLYRWDLRTNTFSESLRLTGGVSEAYTPTVIGADGTAFAIQDGTLFAVGRKGT